MQIKEKKIKEKENKKEKVFCFDFFIEKFPKQTRVTEAEGLFEELSDVEKTEIEKVYGFWLAYWSSIDVKFVPNPFTWLKEKGWKKKIPEKFGNFVSVTPTPPPPKARSEPIDVTNTRDQKKEREIVLQFFREKLDPQIRDKIESQVDKKFLNMPVKKWDFLYTIEVVNLTKQYIS